MFPYHEGMTLEEMTAAVERLIEFMQTEEYWQTHRGNQPSRNEGGELMDMYLKATDALDIPRTKTLIVPYNKTCNMNLSKSILNKD